MKATWSRVTGMALILSTLNGCGGKSDDDDSTAERSESDDSEQSMSQSDDSSESPAGQDDDSSSEQASDPDSDDASGSMAQGASMAQAEDQASDSVDSEESPPSEQAGIEDAAQAADEDANGLLPDVGADSLPMFDAEGNLTNPDDCPQDVPNGACDVGATVCVYEAAACVCTGGGQWRCLDASALGPGDAGVDFGGLDLGGLDLGELGLGGLGAGGGPNFGP